MKKESLVQAFCQLGLVMRNIGENKPWESFDIGITASEYDEFNALMGALKHHNGWFTEEMIRKAIGNLGESLNKENLEQWCDQYTFSKKPKTIAVIMAGNIPLVGFHDFLCVLLSGNRVMAKMSSEDDKLLPVLAEFLICFYPEVKDFISFSDRNMKGFDAVIATGSNSSFLHFEQYFSKYPHIFRKNRTSIAILDGTESESQLKALGDDIFVFFGRGCRSVSHLLLPRSFEINKVFEHIVHQGAVINNKKYGNNYDYNKAVHLMNQEKLLDNNFVLLKETTLLSSPLGMLYYHFYDDVDEVNSYCEEHKDSIQCRVGAGGLPFGTAQSPKLNDYADNVDTMQWLNSL
ncbi:MAG: acyl-CoA reductase [Crocinitomicaceae bacterium]|nr:acyl-CoA reductase [Crocinitomicaceae bacterium]